MSSEKSIAGWVVDHISAIAWTAIGGFSIFGLIENHMCTAWGTSRAGCLAFAGFGLAVGIKVGSWLVRHFETNPVKKALEDANHQIESLTDRITSDERAREKYENQVAGLRAAIDNEKCKNAELAKRWEDLRSADRQRQKTFDALLPKERALLAYVMDVSYSGHVFKASDAYVPILDALVDAGLLAYLGENRDSKIYAPAIDARPWLLEHRHELPAYGSDEYLMGGTILNGSVYHPVDGYPLT